MTKKQICLLTLFASVATTNVLAGQKCTDVTYCIEGEECNGDSCIPCEYGTFQNKTNHKDQECKPWKEEPLGPGWELVVEGTKVRDRVWGCKDGYEIKKISVEDPRCFEISTTKGASVEQTTLSSTTTTAITDNAQSKGGGTSTGTIILIIVVGLLVGLVLVIVLLVSYKYRGKLKSCSWGEDPKQNGNREKMKLLRNTFHSFAAWLTSQLRVEDMHTLLLRLPTVPSFSADTTLSYERNDDSSVKAYTATFIQWREANPNEMPGVITNILNEMGQRGITESDDYRDYMARFEEANGDPTTTV